MHIPDGFLGAPVAATTWVLGGAGLGAALRAERRDPVAVPAGVLGSLAAFVFAAQMVNVPIAAGTSGHLVGATLAAMLVGPWRALIVMAAVLAIQALLFQDGGITAFGANLLDMGMGGAFVGYTVAMLTTRLARGPRGYAIGAVIGAFAATLTGAALTALWLALSGLYPLGGILPVMLVTHTAIGVLEAVLTGAVLVSVLRWRPDLVAGVNGAAGVRRPAALGLGLLGLALLVAAFVAPFASGLPDGLERAALDLGFASRARALMPAPFWETALPRGALATLGPVLAGVVGTLLVGLLAWALTRGLAVGSNEPHR
jgi:cobalt/nickel transport system permease protein